MEYMMVEKTKIIDNEIEIGTSKDIIDRIEEHWFDELNVSSDDYIYIKKVNKHLVIGKARIELIE
ncbi:hypothetical protein B6U98_03190 [Thermoplasmatales archaeon ex4572_165]|nr:MAG: hypothetical protein B6U98_03190 [Thermoplasmatales archaeon ex4572_165]RLF58547.1 MAG: hypothetical protein DRN27_05105 [Thermoplasmata archaeon]